MDLKWVPGSRVPGFWERKNPSNPGTWNPFHSLFLYISQTQWNILIAFYDPFTQSWNGFSSSWKRGTHISFRVPGNGEPTGLSSHPIPRCSTSRNQFRLRHQFHSIPDLLNDSGIDRLRNRFEFPGIPSNSGIRTSIIILLPLTHLNIIRFRSAIPELIDSGIERNRTEFHGIPGNSV